MNKPVISGDTITIPSDAVYLAAVDDFIFKYLKQAGITESDIADISISVSEIVNNAIEYGNHNDIEKKVRVSCGLKGNELFISIKDQGTGFDPDSIPDPTAADNLMKKAGRGIFIARSLLDSVEFNFTDNGTEVILKKNIAAE